MAVGRVIREYRLEVVRSVQPVRRRVRLFAPAEGGDPAIQIRVEFREDVMNCKVTDNSGSTGEVLVEVPFTGFGSVVHLLRTERPIRTLFLAGDLGLFSLATGEDEPVGEGPADHSGPA
jgi:hypothetical protein